MLFPFIHQPKISIYHLITATGYYIVSRLHVYTLHFSAVPLTSMRLRCTCCYLLIQPRLRHRLRSRGTLNFVKREGSSNGQKHYNECQTHKYKTADYLKIEGRQNSSMRLNDGLILIHKLHHFIFYELH